MSRIAHDELLSLVHYNPDTGIFTRTEDGYVLGKPDQKRYLLAWIAGRNYRLHRLAWFYMTGEWPVAEIDHINGKTDDNRWANLRECTHQQNNHNQGKRAHNTSGFKNVSWNKRQGKWHVQVCLNYRVHHGGFYVDVHEADLAARKLRQRLHGDFANHG
ncbi:HNH endonuclease [Pseudomonas monteilii]|uniref:HNH endonuclease n=1 Tax=Pseudomonas monteilii TaxID=76759 RepID=UPI0030CAA0C8